jgi:hypothetical protein
MFIPRLMSRRTENDLAADLELIMSIVNDYIIVQQKPAARLLKRADHMRGNKANLILAPHHLPAAHCTAAISLCVERSWVL